MTAINSEREIMRGKVLTANILNDGVVVYLAPGGAWTEALPEARFLAEETEQARLLRIAEQDVDQPKSSGVWPPWSLTL